MKIKIEKQPKFYCSPETKVLGFEAEQCFATSGIVPSEEPSSLISAGKMSIWNGGQD